MVDKDMKLSYYDGMKDTKIVYGYMIYDKSFMDQKWQKGVGIQYDKYICKLELYRFPR